MFCNKRILNFWNSEYALTSARVKIFLSNPETSKQLANAVRKHRNGEKSLFSITNKDVINKLKECNHAKR